MLGPPDLAVSSAELVLRYALLGWIWLGAMHLVRLDAARYVERVTEEVRRLLLAGAIAAGVVAALATTFGEPLPDPTWAAGLLTIVTLVLATDRSVERLRFARLREQGLLTRRIAVVGTDEHAVTLARHLREQRRYGYDVVGLIGTVAAGTRLGLPVLGRTHEVDALLHAHACTGAILSVASLEAEELNAMTRELIEQGFHVALSTNLHDIDLARVRPQLVDGDVLLYVEPSIRNGWRAAAKRVFDLVLSVTASLVTLPLLVVVAVFIKIDSRGPILFRQERVGRNGERFQMLKLRTMVADAEAHRDELRDRNEASGPLFKIREDPRITRVGRVLRRLSIDELPQFWNVIRGDMSVVGPRPALPNEVAEWDSGMYRRVSVLPGITGMWQVSGRSDVPYDQYRRLDLYYVDNWSLRHDLDIVVKTAWAVLGARGAS